MRIETRRQDVPVDVEPAGRDVELRIGEPRDGVAASALLSLPQAEMLLHALGLAIAQIRDRERIETEEAAGMAQRVLEQEIRRG